MVDIIYNLVDLEFDRYFFFLNRASSKPFFKSAFLSCLLTDGKVNISWILGKQEDERLN